MRALVLMMAAAFALQAAGPLAIVRMSVQQSEGGPPLPPRFTHIPGEVIFFSFQVEGYRVSPQSRISLDTKMEAFDPHGVPIAPPMTSKVEAELTPEDKEWRPKVQHDLAIPPLAPSGDYRIAVSVTDNLVKATASKEFAFEVRGHDVEPSPTLTIRNFHFYRGEEDQEPLAKPVYRPGDPVWMRFDIAGYKLGPSNAVDVSYGIALIAASGNVLWSNPQAAVEQSRSFYPKPYVPASGSISLGKDIRPGDYTIVVNCQDSIGNQHYEMKQNFTVE